MSHRSTTFIWVTVALLLAIFTGGLVYRNWSSLVETAFAVSPSLRWLTLLIVALASPIILAYILWRLLNRRQHSMIQTDALNSMVHEFQTPISSIRMAIDILDSPIARNHPERTDKYIRIIREETERLQHQVETMLTLARADRNTLVLNPEPVQIHQLLRSVAERHGDYLQLQLASIDQYLLADRMHLTNILHNLLDNAVKYSADTPEVTIQTKANSDGFVISVKDRGVGISPAKIQHIFQPFYRIHDQDSPCVKGFGLGLSYVQRIVQAHAWAIWVKSEMGKGSEFTIQIPPDSIISSRTSAPSHQIA